MKTFEVKLTKLTRKIIHKEFSLITCLISSGRNNTEVIAVILCEMHFTNTAKRMFEYAAYILFSIVSPRNKMTLSVGIAQVQVRHWMKLGVITEEKSILRSMISFQNIFNNYDLASRYLSFTKSGDPEKSLLARYRGEARQYHFRLYLSIEQSLRKHILSFSRA